MSVITVIKKIGERVISIVEAPFKYAAQTEKVLATGIEDAPELKAAIVGLVQRFEELGPEVLEAIAAKGLDIPEDLKCAGDVKVLFEYFTSTFMPVVESTIHDFQGDVHAPALESSVAPKASDTPGLHNVVAQ